MTSETNLVRLILLAASKAGHRLFRQNTGQGWIGESHKLPDGSVLIKNARPFHAGFDGLSDTGGWVSIIVTPEMVGQRIAVAAYLEVKTEKGRPTLHQRQFIQAVLQAGGRAGIVRSVDEALAVLDGTQRPFV